MSKKGKFIIIGGSIIAGVAIVTPLSIIANQMISSNSILKFIYFIFDMVLSQIWWKD